MPDDRPLSKDLQPGTVLRAGLGRVVTLDQRAMNCWLVFVPSVMGTRRLSDWLSDDAIDALDSPWSILPSDEPRCTCSPMDGVHPTCDLHGQRAWSDPLPSDEPPAPVSKSSIETVTRQDYADSVDAVHRRLTEPPAALGTCRLGNLSGPHTEHSGCEDWQPIVPALPSDEEAEPPGEDLAHRLNRLLHHAMNAGKPCETACTHWVREGWSILGVSNVAARRITEIEKAQRALDTSVVVPDADGGQP